MRRKPSRLLPHNREGEASTSRPALHDQWLRRNVHFPGSAPEYAESPLARFWAKAADSRADAAEKVAQIREQHQHQKQGFGGNRWRRRKSS